MSHAGHADAAQKHAGRSVVTASRTHGSWTWTRLQPIAYRPDAW